MKTKNMEVSDEQIAHRAYEIWQARGCPAGDGSDDWQTAEAELCAGGIACNGSNGEHAESWWSRFRKKISGRDA